MTQIERHRRASLAATIAAEREEAFAAEWTARAAAASTPERRANALRYAGICKAAAVRYYQQAEGHDREALRLALETVAAECAILIAA